VHPNLQEICPNLSEMYYNSAIRTLVTTYFPQIVLTEQALKIQLNELGGFPLHCDAHPSTDNRLFTCILYLNELKSGGELELYPSYNEKVVI